MVPKDAVNNEEGKPVIGTGEPILLPEQAADQQPDVEEVEVIPVDERGKPLPHPVFTRTSDDARRENEEIEAHRNAPETRFSDPEPSRLPKVILGIIGVLIVATLIAFAAWIGINAVNNSTAAAGSMATISSSFGAMQKDVGQLKTDVNAIKTNGATKADVAGVQLSVDELAKTAASKVEVKALADQVKTLSDNMATLPANIEAIATAAAKKALANAPKPKVQVERVVVEKPVPVPTPAPAPAPAPEKPKAGSEIAQEPAVTVTPAPVQPDDTALDARVFGYLKGQHPKVSDENLRADVASMTRDEKLAIDAKIGKYVGKKSNGFWSRLKGKSK